MATNWQDALRNYELAYYQQVLQAKLKTMRKIIKELANSPDIPQWISQEHIQTLYELEYKMTKKVMPLALTLTSAELVTVLNRLDSTLSLPVIQHSQLAAEYISQHGLFRASEKTKTYINDIRNLINNNPRLPSRQLAREIVKVIPDIARYRAETIAITEVNGASAYANHHLAKETNSLLEQTVGRSLMKTWIATRDKRTRHTHTLVNGRTIPFHEQFIVGGAVMDRPHDPTSPPSEVINCRCVLGYGG